MERVGIHLIKKERARCAGFGIIFALVFAGSLFNAPAQTTGTDCTNLCLQQVNCPGGAITSVSGTVYAPNGIDPIYKALVYVPNGTVQPFPPGVHCSQCGGEVSGEPLVSTMSAADGTFTLQNMPVGKNIPLVIQIGRWRRVTTIPAVSACVNTPLPASMTRLPTKQGEFSALDNIPLIAIVTAQIDGLECLLLKIGIDPSQFSNPASQGGTGRVRFYLGEGAPGAKYSALTPSATQLWGSQTEINQYDMVFFPNQGAQYAKTAAQQTIVINYVNAGGRVLASRYSYVWLYNDAPFSSTAQWNVNQTIPADQTAYINTSFPRSLALAQWLQYIGATTTFGQMPLATIRHNFNGVVPPSQLWMSLGAPPTTNFTVPVQYTFNAPVGAPPSTQCGRVLYTDYSAEDAFDNTGITFPAECARGAMTPQEKLFEFAIFDLEACIDSQVPPPNLISVTTQSNQVIIAGQGTSSSPFMVQASTNLHTGFKKLGTATSDSTGNFQYRDTNTAPQKFYRSYRY